MTCEDSLYTILTTLQFDGLNMTNSTAIACRPNFSRVPAELSVNSTSMALTSVPAVDESISENVIFPGMDGAFPWIENVLKLKIQLLDVGIPDPLLSWYPPDPEAFPADMGFMYDPWYWLLSHIQRLDGDALVDPSVLTLACRQMFSVLWPHVSQTQNMFSPSTEEYMGESKENVRRLVCRAAQARALEALLLAIGVGFVTLAMTQQDGHVVRNPGSLASMAIVLGSSHETDRLLAQTGSLSTKAFEDRLQGWHFRTGVDVRGRICIQPEWKEENVSFR
jgi:hypothetical protein